MHIKLNFFNFMHKQLLIQIYLTLVTGLGYIYMGWLYASLNPALIWYAVVLVLSLYGFKLHKEAQRSDMSILEKDAWLVKTKIFLFSYFSLWSVMFIINVFSDIKELHYIAISTQLGISIVSGTLLVSQRKMAYITLLSLMLPLAIYFIVIGESYSYLLAFFTLVLCVILMYAAYNTNRYLLKSKTQAYQDYLTKLGNRHYFTDILNDAITTHKKEPSHLFLLLIDLDHFKTVNDSLGHDIGDKLLIEVARRMQKLADESNKHIARIGGDEFCILSKSFLSQNEAQEEIQQFAKILLSSIKETYYILDHHIYISASIGISTIKNSDLDSNNFLKEADIAMYEAKRQGRNEVIVFNDELSNIVQRKLEIERLLHFSLQKNEISLNYQPQINLKNQKISCEVLVRWNNDKLGSISPEEFIPLAENSGFIIELGYYILEESFKTFQEWEKKGLKLQQLSINISMRQIFHKNFLTNIEQLISKYLSQELCAKLLFEITETSVADDIETLIAKMHTIRKLGINFSIDDFGTGYSSLNYLKRLPIDELKIDKSFILDLHASEESNKMVKTILSIANNLNLTVVAEGVENASQQEFLSQHSCDILQGFYFSQPISKISFEKFIKENTA